jgi:hypothetical protein
MISIKLDIQPPLENLKYWIEHVEKNVINDLSDFWDGWARKLVAEEIARIFATQGYGTWAALSPRYAMRKSRIYPGRTILRAKDVYFKASTRKGAAGNIFESKPTEMTWGADEGYFESLAGFPYPIVLEKGNKKGTLPARHVYEMAQYSEALQANLVKGLSDYLHKRINAEATKVFK